jgi:[acyl-carrier-protein] S-malonyltransferase
MGRVEALMEAKNCPLIPEISNEVWKVCHDVFGRELRAVAESGTAEELSRTEVAQPIIAACSLIIAKAFFSDMNHGVAAGIGHSLGEYVLFAAAGMITTEEMFALIKVRSRAMSACCVEHPGVMTAVMGADPCELLHLCETACRQTGGMVLPVNYNSDVQTVIAGDLKSVKAVTDVLDGQGIRTVMLPVAGAFHTPLMKPAAEGLRAAARKMNITPKPPAFSLFSNITGGDLTEIPEYKEDPAAFLPDYLARHMISPVRFTHEIRNLRESYPDIVFVEYGKTLTAMTRKIK